MPVKIIRGAIGAGKKKMCMDEIRKVHEKYPGDRCVMLVPDHYSFETEKAFVDTFGGTGLNNIDVMTPRKMAMTFLSAADLKYLSETGRQMLIARAVNEYCTSAESSPLIRTMKTPGFADVMNSLIAEMKLYCVSPEMLALSAAKTENTVLKNKLNAVCEIYGKYNEFFENGQYTDSADDLLRTAEYIRTSGEFDGHFHLWIDSFDELMPQHMEIVGAFADCGADITVCLNYPENDEYFTYECISDTYEKIRSLNGFTEDIVLDGSLSHVKSGEIKFLLENYNNFRAVNDNEISDISLFAGRDTYGEIEHTAGEILRLVRENGYRYRDIAVMCADSAGVGHIIKAVFDEYKIPYFSDEKITLCDHPIAMQLLSVFDMFDEDWSYNSVMRYLRAGFIYDADFHHADETETDKLDNFALKYGIRGRKKWLEDYWEKEQNTFERVWDEEEQHEADDEETAVNNVKTALMTPVLELYRKVRNGHNAYDYSTAVFELLEDIHMYGGLKKDVRRFENEGKMDEAQQFSQIWNLILETLDQTVVTMGERKMSFAEYGAYVRAGLSKCEIRTIPSRLDSVCVGSAERSTAAPVKALFVTGAVSGTYPDENADEGFFSDSDRAFLKEECDITLSPPSKDKLTKKHFKVYKAIAPVTEKLYISYPVQTGEGKAMRPARLIGDIRRMFPKLETQDNIITDLSDKSYISSPEATVHKLLINKSKNSHFQRSTEWETVYRWFKNNGGYDDKLQLLETASDFDGRTARLNGTAAKMLFGDESVYSASRLNTYAECPFSYFMQYGLGAREQEVFEIAAKDFGTYAHRFIQEFCVRVEDGADTPQKKLDKWKNLTDDDRNGIIESISRETKERITEFNAPDEKRRLNMVDRITKTVRGSAETVHKSLKYGSYTTNGFEREFDKIPLGDGVYIKGAVDRIDSRDDGKNEYIRIIDYKTGSTGFDILNIYDRINMQMVIYAIAVKKAEEETKHRKAELSGMFYNKVRDDFDKLAPGTEHGTGNARMDGVIFVHENEDGTPDMESVYAFDENIRPYVENHDAYKSDFLPLKLYKNGKIETLYSDTERDALTDYVMQSIKDIDREIKSGKIEAYPYEESGGFTACGRCVFGAACIFESDCTRKKSKNKDKVWKKILKGRRTNDELDG